MQDEMDDWWSEFKRQEDECREFEESLIKLQRMVSQMKMEPQEDFELTAGTCLQGKVSADYFELVDTFGQPMEGDGYKTQVEWVLLFTLPDGEQIVATIYDWKKDELPEFVTDWNVGGNDYRAAELVIDYLNYARDMKIMNVRRPTETNIHKPTEDEWAAWVANT